MRYQLVIPSSMAQDLKSHLLGDRTREQMAIILCGLKRSGEYTCFLGRHLVLMPPEAFSHQSAGSLELAPAVQRYVLQLAAHECLSQVDWHTHPGDGPSVGFSGIDDRSERDLAVFLSKRIQGTLYASVVLNSRSMAARVWETKGGRPIPVPIAAPDFENPLSLPFSQEPSDESSFDMSRFDRQVRAFGVEFQRRLQALTVGIVGLGGLGSIIAEQLARLGIRNWVLVDPDQVEASNLNRLLGATARDVERERTKVTVAGRNIHRIDKNANVKVLRSSVFAKRALNALKKCNFLIAVTDNHASRLVLNALACQYLIPLVHVGVNLERGEDGTFQDVSGEFAIPPLGEWCLLCSGIIDAQRASWDLAAPEERSILVQRGYLADVPAPAVYHLNGIIASLAVTEIHNLIWQYKPLRRYLVYRELEGELMSLEVPHRESCMHCSPEGLLGLGDLTPFWSPRQKRSLLDVAIPAADDDASDKPDLVEKPQENMSEYDA
jgi:hypothetical protein